MKRILIALFGAMLLVVSLGTPAFAGNYNGLHWYSFTTYCGPVDYVGIYVDTWHNVVSGWHIEGRADFQDQACVVDVDVTYIKLWVNPGNPHLVAQNGSHLYPVSPGNDYVPLDTSGSDGCGKVGSVVHVGDRVWTEFKFTLWFANGTTTTLRDFNSNNWTVASGECGGF